MKKMSIDERRRYLKRVAPRYGRANKADWGLLTSKDDSSNRVTSQEPDTAGEHTHQYQYLLVGASE